MGIKNESTTGDPKQVYSLADNNLAHLIDYHPSPKAPYSIISIVDAPAGSVLTSITTSTSYPEKTWATVQTSPMQHIALNSALLYMNHSCDPSVEIDVKTLDVRVVAKRDLKKGDHITFFYPSTEWEMARGFDCECGSDHCLGHIDGARSMGADKLRKTGLWVNEWIWDELQAR
jgi:hypothetical protein